MGVSISLYSEGSLVLRFVFYMLFVVFKLNSC